MLVMSMSPCMTENLWLSLHLPCDLLDSLVAIVKYEAVLLQSVHETLHCWH